MRAAGRIIRVAAAIGLVVAAGAGASVAGAKVVPGQLVVQYRDGTAGAARVDVRADAGVTRAAAVAPGIDLVQAPAGEGAHALADLRDDPRVAAVAPNTVLREQALPAGGLDSRQWAPAVINAPAAWDITTTGALTAVIDSGFQGRQGSPSVPPAHPDLAANSWQNPGETGLDGGGQDRATNLVDDDHNGYVDDAWGWNWLTNSGLPHTVTDTKDHGTHVAGIIGADGTNGTGATGVAWSVPMMDLHVINNWGTATLGSLLSAMQYAGDNGARVVNGSLGGSGESTDLRDLYTSITDQFPDTLFVFAAGNAGADLDQQPGLMLPCEAAAVRANVLCVAATGQGDGLAPYSNHGSAVTIAAPGTNIWSTFLNGGFDYLSGTSMATPQVSGAAALLMHQRPGLTGAQARAIIQASARPVAGLLTAFPGGGLLDTASMLGGLDPSQLSGPSAFGVASPAPGGISEQATPTVQWTASTSQALVTSYTVELDGRTMATVPWRTTQWTAPSLPNGTHSVRIVATDTLGRQAATDPVTIEVAVPAASTPPTPTPTPTAAPARAVSQRAAALAAARRRHAAAIRACRRKPTRSARAACTRAANKAYRASVARARRLPA